jgi:predicted transcriptional regulator with HTH domain
MLIEMMAHYPEKLNFDEAAKIVGTHFGKIRGNSKVLGEHLVQKPNSKELKNIGLGLVEVKPDPYEPEKEIFELTKKGMALKAMLLDALS